MKEIKFALPSDADSVTGKSRKWFCSSNVRTEDVSSSVITFMSKKAIFPKCGIVLRSYIDDFGFLVYDVLDTNGDKLISAHVESAYEDEIMRINEYVSKEKIELDFDKQVVVKKRWRAYYNLKSTTFIEYVEVKTIERVKNTMSLMINYYEMGNYFRTREQAEKVAKEIRGNF
jgi:hypothetical protein